ncbi:heparan-sulfate 6-O-sulfotransferase 1-like isoform X2 [Ptychodera flava]
MVQYRKRPLLLLLICVVGMIIIVTKSMKYGLCDERDTKIISANSFVVVPNTTKITAGKKVGNLTTLQPRLSSKKPVATAAKTTHSTNVHRIDTCEYLDKITANGSFTNCTVLFDYVRRCVNTRDIGRTPLPNFFTDRNQIDDITDDAYRRAHIAFVHLPKAGGTSVEEILKKAPRLYKNGIPRTSRVAHCRDFYRQSKGLRYNREETLFYSKRTFGLHSYTYPGLHFAYVTWFREPLDRLISTYHYTRRMHCFGVHEVCIHYLVKSANLTDYLMKTPDIYFQDMDNFYVRLLQFGNYPDVDATFEDCCGGIQMGEEKRIPKIEEKHYLIAKRNLQMMAFVGLTEDFKTSQSMLSYIFSIPDENEVTHVNANPHKYVMTDYELKELTRRNIWDLKLYEDAKKIYELQKKRYLEIKGGS